VKQLLIFDLLVVVSCFITQLVLDLFPANMPSFVEFGEGFSLVLPICLWLSQSYNKQDDEKKSGG
jgi:hypothetical protein